MKNIYRSCKYETIVHLDYNQTIVIHTSGLKSVMYTLQDLEQHSA